MIIELTSYINVSVDSLFNTLSPSLDSTDGHAKYTVMFYLARGLFIHCRHGNRRAFDMLNVLTATLDTPTYTQCLQAVGKSYKYLHSDNE